MQGRWGQLSHPPAVDPICSLSSVGSMVKLEDLLGFGVLRHLTSTRHTPTLVHPK